MIKELRTTKILEIEYNNNGETAAHVCCITNQGKKQLRIVDLFALEDYADSSFEDMLMDEVFQYAYENDINQIVTYIGPEPYNPKPYRSIDDEVRWYEGYGFEAAKSACSFASCMVCKVIPPVNQEC